MQTLFFDALTNIFKNSLIRLAPDQFSGSRLCVTELSVKFQLPNSFMLSTGLPSKLFNNVFCKIWRFNVKLSSEVFTRKTEWKVLIKIIWFIFIKLHSLWPENDGIQIIFFKNIIFPIKNCIWADFGIFPLMYRIQTINMKYLLCFCSIWQPMVWEHGEPKLKLLLVIYIYTYIYPWRSS